VCDSARESCPFFPGDNIIHKSFEEPTGVEGSHGQVLAVFEKVRDEIIEWIKRTFNK
jgi:arsenate reductase